jgi:stage V sporulation protein G
MLKVINLRFNNTGSIVKAFADIDYEGLIITSLRVIDGKQGLFVSMPREKGKDDKYYDIVRASDIVIKSNIEKAVLDTYYQMSKNQLPPEA